MKKYYTFIASLIFLLTNSPPLQAQITNYKNISGNVSLTLRDALWKPGEKQGSLEDITLDLVCQQSQCDREVWGYAPEFNIADHDGKLEVIDTDNEWRLRVKININPDPWRRDRAFAEYTLKLTRYKDQIIGSYQGKFGDRAIAGKVRGTINPYWPKQISDYQPIQPQEHPRLIFRKEELPALRQKARTDYGKAIIAQLKNRLAQEIYYEAYVPNGGYHAAGHCFLSLLNGDKQEAQKGWQIVQNSLQKPGRRLLEKSSVVAGVALAYDLCYQVWDEERRKKITNWLAQEAEVLATGEAGNAWNGYSWSNWSARARSAAGLAALAIMYEPETYFNEPTDSWRIYKIAQRNIKRYLEIALGEKAFGTEGDLYTRESLHLIMPFILATQNVLAQDLVEGSSAPWFLPHYITRIVPMNGEISVATYGRHRLGPDSSVFALGLNIVPKKFLPAVMWFFDRNFGWGGDRSFAVGEYSPHDAIYALRGYRENISPQNPAAVFGHVLADKQKGFYVFRNRWNNSNDFVASIYLKRQYLKSSWSFPDEGSFRIWGLGEKWAIEGPSEKERDSENVVVGEIPWRIGAQPVFFRAESDGSGIVSMKRYNWLRSFAVDYSGRSGTPGLFVVVDKFSDPGKEKTWVMHTEGKVDIQGQSFTINSPTGATMRGTFVTPDAVNISFEPDGDGGIIKATGGDRFFVVMTVQKDSPPKVEVTGNGLNASVKIGDRIVSFQGDRIVLETKH